MNEHFRSACLLFLLCILSLMSQSQAQSQTITTTFKSVAICPGSTVTATFTTSGTAVAGPYSLQLSDATGQFPASPVIIGTSSTTGTIGGVVPANTQTSSRYVLRVVSSKVTGSPGSGNLTVARPPAPAIPTQLLTYCEGDRPTALMATGTSLKWYGANPNGLGTGTPTVPATDQSRTYYVSQTVDGCESEKAEINVTVKPKPDKPSVKTPQQACLGDDRTELTAPGGTLRWYATEQGGTASATTPQPPTSTAGSTVYYVSQIVGSCESDRARIDFKVNDRPAAPSAPSLTYCQGATAVPLMPNGPTIRWYDATGNSIPTPTPSTASPGSQTYSVGQTVGDCESQSRTLVVVTIIATPGKPSVSGSQTICSGSPAAPLSATASAGNSLRWRLAGQTGFLGSPPTVNNTSTATYFVSQATAGGCESDQVGITVTVKPVPGAPGASASAPLCQNQSSVQLQATAQKGATLNWFDSNDQPLPNAPTPPTSTTGTLTYYVRQTLDGCPGTDRATVRVTVNPVPAVPSFTTPAPVCQGAQAQPLSASGTNQRWYGTNATGGNGSAQATTPTTNVAGTQTYYVTQTVNSCESDRAGIPVRVKDTPGAPNVPGLGTFDFCQNTTAPTLTATPAPNATVAWFDASGKALGNTVTPPNNTVTTYTYTVSQTLEGCTGPPTAVRSRVKPLPGAPGVSPVAFCNNAPAQRLTASGERLKWYDAANNFIGSDAPVPATNNVGRQQFNVSQTNGDNCEGPKATLTVDINALPGLPGVSNVTYCKSEQDQPQQNVRQLEASGQNLRWYNADGNNVGTPTPAIDRIGTQVFNVSQTVNNCEGGRARLEVTVNTAPLPIVPKTLYTYCVNDVATPLVANAEAGGSLRWINPYGQLSSQPPTPPTLNTNIDPTGDQFQVYQVGANQCVSARSTIRVVVNTVPTLSLTAPSNSVNLGQRAPLQLRFTGSGPYSYTLTGNNIGTSNRADTTINVLPRGTTTYQVLNVTNGCGTGLPGNPATAEVLVRVPTLATGTLSTTSLCGGSSLSVPFSQTGQFNPGNVFRLELASVADTSRWYDMGVAAGGSPITSPVSATLPGGQYYVRVKASNPEIGITGSNSPTILTVKAPATATLSGTQNIYEGTPANLTIALGGDGPWMLTYADSLRSYQTTTVVSPLVVEARPGRTTTYRLTSVTGFCGTGTATGTATIRVLPLLGVVDDDPLDPLVNVYPVPTGATLTVELDWQLLRDPAVLSVTNMTGQLLLKTPTHTRKTTLDLSQQPSGQYLLRIQVGEKQTVRRVIKL